MKTDVTILTTVKNEEKYIGATIQSILDQTYGNFEFWIIDDGSTDKTLTVVKSFKDSRIKVIHFDKNTGMTPRLNWAIPRIKTRFVARMDSHNLCDKTRLQKQHDFMLVNPKVMALGSNYDRIDKNGKLIMKTNFPAHNKEIKCKLMEKNLFKHASMFIRREVYNKVGLYDPYFRVTQDYDFILRVASKYPVANLTESLVTDIYLGQNMTQKHRLRSAWEALTAQYNGLTKYGYPLWQSVYLVRGIAYLLKSGLYQLIS